MDFSGRNEAFNGPLEELRQKKTRLVCPDNSSRRSGADKAE